MQQLLRLAAMFFVLVAIGCASHHGVGDGSHGGSFKPEEVPGTWSLTDDENCTFDVRLSAKGGAVSNWSKGPASAQGESGHWTLEGNRIVIDYTDGWRDVILHSKTESSRGKFQKVSFAPDAPHDGPPSNSGLAVRTGDTLAQWVGVYELPRAATAETRSFFMSLQSTHAAWKSVNEIRVGSWWPAGNSVRIRWADGWINELTQTDAGLEVHAWMPGTQLDANGAPVGTPTIAGKARRVE